MSRLSKFLESLQRNVVVIQSKSTNSQYFELGSTKIRVSDHFSDRECAGHIQVVIPFNSKTTYLCKIKEGAPVLVYTLKELKQFISNYVLINNIKQHTSNFEEKKKEISKEQSKKDKEENQKKAEAIAKVAVDPVKPSKLLSKMVGFNIDDPANREACQGNYTKCMQDIKRQLHFRIGDLNDKKRRIIKTNIILADIPWIEVINRLRILKDTGILKKPWSEVEKYILTNFK